MLSVASIIVESSLYHNDFSITNLIFETADLQSALHEHIQPFDADILDLEIPTMNGLEVVKEVLAMNVGLD
jgi:DNA-binding response OmpR family regulator